MKIAVDGYEIGIHSTGVGRVIDNLLAPLFDILPEDTFTIFTAEVADKYSQSQVDQVILSSRGGYLRWLNGPFRRGLNKLAPDLLIAPNYILPLFSRLPSILFEHDLSVMAHPEWYPRRFGLTRRFLISRSLKKADIIIVPSEFTKKEILSHVRLDPAKIRFLRYGVGKQFQRSREESLIRWKKEKGLTGRRAVGFLGSIFNRRHIPELVKAAELLRKDVPDLVLFIAGRDLTHAPLPIAGILDKKWIRWEPMIPENELPLFYSSLEAFAYLSEYEGFGLPPLEALACGTVPVLLDRSSLGEIFRNIAVMVENPVPEEIRAALAAAMNDKGLTEGILSRFREKKEEFSWVKAAREFSLIIKEFA